MKKKRNFKNKKPLFSIITCTKNSSRFLPMNIKSVKNQTCKNYEHIFVDGYSDDSTLDILKIYKKANKNIHIYFRKAKGMVDAMNYGVKMSQGKYVIHLNSDDMFDNQFVLQSVYSYFEKNIDSDWIFGKINLIDQYNNNIGHFPKKMYAPLLKYNILKYYNFVPHQSVFIKKSLFAKYGYFNKSIKHLSEYDYWLKIGKHTRWSFIDMYISKYRFWSGSSSHDNTKIAVYKKCVLDIQSNYLSGFEFVLAKFFNMIVFIYTKYIYLYK